MIVPDAPCPMENAVGDQFFHVIDSEFPSHVFENSVLEFDVQSSFGPGPDDLADVVACVDGASGYLSIGDTTIEGMPMMDGPICIAATGSTGSDAQIVGQSVAVAVGVTNVAGDAGTYAVSVAQVCAQDGAGCEQPCADPIVPVGAAIPVIDGTLANDGAVCGEDLVLDEDGMVTRLGRAGLGLLPVEDAPTMTPINTAQSCVLVDFGAPTMANTVRVVGSWVRDAACGGVECFGPECGTGHSYGVWVTADGATFTHLGMAQGSDTTTSNPADPQAPEPPIVGEHFLAGTAVSGVLVCRLAFAPEADSVAIDYVELCPPP